MRNEGGFQTRPYHGGFQTRPYGGPLEAEG